MLEERTLKAFMDITLSSFVTEESAKEALENAFADWNEIGPVLLNRHIRHLIFIGEIDEYVKFPCRFCGDMYLMDELDEFDLYCEDCGKMKDSISDITLAEKLSKATVFVSTNKKGETVIVRFENKVGY